MEDVFISAAEFIDLGEFELKISVEKTGRLDRRQARYDVVSKISARNDQSNVLREILSGESCQAFYSVQRTESTWSSAGELELHDLSRSLGYSEESGLCHL